MSESGKSSQGAALESALKSALSEVLPGKALGLGVDIQRIADINIENPNFIERNFTPAEIAYCEAAPNPHASFAGRWAAKEAVVKAKMNLFPEGPNRTKGAAAPLIDIEVLPGNSGAPYVVQHGHALENAKILGVSQIKVSISHSGEYVAAVAVIL